MIGWYSASFCGIVVATLLLLAWRRKVFEWAILGFVAIVVHPAWTMRADMGDCGVSKRFFSVAITLVLLTALAVQTFFPAMSMRRFLGGLTMIAWVSAILDWSNWHLPYLRDWLPLVVSENDAFIAFTMSAGPLLLVSLLLTFVYLVLRIADGYEKGGRKGGRVGVSL